MVKPNRAKRVASLMKNALSLFGTKNDGYGEAYIKATEVMDLLVSDKSLVKTRFQKLVYHNMYAIVTKMLRACSITFYSGSDKSEDLMDSWRDIGVYAFMIEEICDDLYSDSLDEKESQ